MKTARTFRGLPKVLSIGQMYRRLRLSRSRFYQLIASGALLPPLRPEGKMAYYTKARAVKNLAVRENNCGVDGKPCVFYMTGRTKIMKD